MIRWCITRHLVVGRSQTKAQGHQACLSHVTRLLSALEHECESLYLQNMHTEYLRYEDPRTPYHPTRHPLV